MHNLEEITYNTLKALETQKTILPMVYNKTFREHANEVGIDFDDEETKLTIADHSLASAQALSQKSEENLNKLSATTQEAKDAMDNNDSIALNEVMKKMKDLQEEIKRLKEDVYQDGLTGALNRKWLDDNLLVDRNVDNDSFFVFIDLNDFKHINDNYGHVVGDKVLIYLTRYFEKIFRLEFDNNVNYNIVRFGGDEFIIAIQPLRGVTIESINEAFSKHQESLCKNKLKTQMNGEPIAFYIGFSYGALEVKKGNSFARVVEEVDKIMYRNKTQIKAKCAASRKD
jgi:diguanylate cyclase (GGDEF)-like protein